MQRFLLATNNILRLGALYLLVLQLLRPVLNVTFYVPNLMHMSEKNRFSSFAFDLAHVKCSYDNCSITSLTGDKSNVLVDIRANVKSMQSSKKLISLTL